MSARRVEFQVNGYHFRITGDAQDWHLAYQRDGEWVALSTWRSKREAHEAAWCFVPAGVEAMRGQPDV